MRFPFSDLRRHWTELRCRGFLAQLEYLGRRLSEKAQRKLNFSGIHRFTDRSRGNCRMLVILAGYKPPLWPLVIPRIARHAPVDLDVCLCLPGGAAAEEMHRFAEQYDWSVLETDANLLSLAINLAIQKHPRAEYIFKLDEDMFIAEGFFEDLQSGLATVEEAGVHRPGLVVPVINVNGGTYLRFLDTVGQREAYQSRFGEIRQACSGIAAHHDPAAAAFLWEHALPIDTVADRFRAQGFGYETLPIRFSIGAFLMRRELWGNMGGFDVAAPGVLGWEEKQVCEYCMDASRPIVVLRHVFAGHFAFGPQYESQSDRLERGELQID